MPANNAKEAYVKSKQQKDNDTKQKVNIEVVVDERQVEKAIDTAMRRALSKINN